MSLSHQCDVDFLFLFYKYLLTAKNSAKERQICTFVRHGHILQIYLLENKNLVYQTFIMQDEPVVLGILPIIYWEKKLVCHMGRKI